MKKRKSLFILLSLVLVLSISFAIYQNAFTSTNLNLFIQNDTDTPLKDLSIYCNDEKINTIYTLEPQKYINFKFDFPQNFNEGKIVLKYNDNGFQKETIICGYIENNSHKKIKLLYTTNNKFNIQ